MFDFKEEKQSGVNTRLTGFLKGTLIRNEWWLKVQNNAWKYSTTLSEFYGEHASRLLLLSVEHVTEKV